MIKSKRTVTVDNSSGPDNEKISRRQSVFERLGPGALLASSKERQLERPEQCRNWLRKGECSYGNLCKYEHKPLSSSSKRSHDKSDSSERRKKSKGKYKNQSCSPSPTPFKQNREKHGFGLGLKGNIDHETKLRSTIVKPKSLDERYEKYSKGDHEKRAKKSKMEIVKKPLEQQWEEDEQEDSDDWDAEEALTLEIKRQELKRELEIEMLKEEALRKGNKAHDSEKVSKKVVSSSSSSSSSSRSSSASSSSASTSSSSSSSDSGSDSDSSDSSSASSPRTKRLSRSRKKLPHHSKYKPSLHNREKTSVVKTSSKSSKGPRTPSPAKPKRSKTEYEFSDSSHYEQGSKPRRKTIADEVERKRQSISPPTSYASSDVNLREESRRKHEDKRLHMKLIESSPPRSYSGANEDRSEGSKYTTKAPSSARREYSQLSPPRERLPLSDAKRGRSPLSYSSRKGGNRTPSPKDIHDLKGVRYGHDKRRSMSPNKAELAAGHKDYHGRDHVAKLREEDRRAEDPYLPVRNRHIDSKSGRYAAYNESEHSQLSPSADMRSRKSHESSLRLEHASHPRDGEILSHGRRNDKHDARGSYGTESRRVLEEDFVPREGRNYREPEYVRGSAHDRGYLQEHPRDRDRDPNFRNVDARRDPQFFRDPPREREYGRQEYADREYFGPDLQYGGGAVGRDNVGRGFVESNDRRREPVYGVGGRDRIRDRYDDRFGERDRDRFGALPPEKVDHHPRRFSRQGQYLPEDEYQNKPDWHPPYSEYRDPGLHTDRYKYPRMDYPPMEAVVPAHGWDDRRRAEEDRDLYYGRSQHARVENDRQKRRRGESPFLNSSREDRDHHLGKRVQGPAERDFGPRRERRERDVGRDPNQSKDSDKSFRLKDQDKLKASDPNQYDRRNRKRERSPSVDGLLDHQSSKRPREMSPRSRRQEAEEDHLKVDQRTRSPYSQRSSRSESGRDRNRPTPERKFRSGSKEARGRSRGDEEGCSRSQRDAESKDECALDSGSEFSRKRNLEMDLKKEKRRSKDVGGDEKVEEDEDGGSCVSKEWPDDGDDKVSIKDGEGCANADEDCASKATCKADGGMSDDGSHKSSSPIPEKTVVVDEIVNDSMPEDKVVDACKVSGSEDNKEEEELSDWSDAEDELLTRDEIVEQNDDNEVDAPESNSLPEATVKENVEVPQKIKRLEELKADHIDRDGSSRSSSKGRQYSDRNNRSLSSERSREESWERIRSRNTNRDAKERRSRNDRARSSSYSSRSSSRNASIDRGRKENSLRNSDASSKPNKEAIDKSRAKDVSGENFDYDPISDDELEAMIEEPKNDEINAANLDSKNTGIVDALNVDWASLMGNVEESVDKPKQTKAGRRFKPGRIFLQIGFSTSLVDRQLANDIRKVCNEELIEESKENGTENGSEFEMKHKIAALHSIAMSQKEDREHVLTNIGPFRRALCARQDLKIRQKLCRFHHRLPDNLTSTLTPTQHNGDPEVYQLSVQLFKNALQASEKIF